MSQDYGPNRSAPHAVEAEEAVLGSVLINPEALDELPFLRADFFYLHKHRWIWDAFGELRRQQLPIDLITVTEELERHKQLAEVGGVAYLTKLINTVPTSLHAEAYGRLVEREAVRRSLLEAATQIAKLAYEEERPIEAVIADADAALRAVNERRQVGLGTMRPMADVMSEIYNQIQYAQANPDFRPNMPTGFVDLDALIDGLWPGELTFLMGAPGTGKSLLAMQIAQNLGAQNFPGAVFELEMPDVQVGRRLIVGEAKRPGLSPRGLRKGVTGNEDDTVAMLEAMNELSQLPVWIDQGTDHTTTTVRAILAAMVREYGIRWFVVDFLDLLKDRAEDKNEREAQIARALHEICKDLGLAGLVVHTENKTGLSSGLPRMEHASGSVKITYAADNLLFVREHIPDDPDAEPDPNLRTIVPAKMRDGEIRGKVNLVKLPGYPAFADLEDDSPSFAGPTNALPY